MGYRLENVEKQRAIANAPNDPRSGENAYFRAIFVIALFLFAFSQSRAVFYSLRALSDTGHRRLFCNPASKSIVFFLFSRETRSPRFPTTTPLAPQMPRPSRANSSFGPQAPDAELL